MKRNLSFLLLTLSVSVLAQNTPNNAALQAEAKKLAAWGKDSVIVKAVKEQNAKKQALADIQNLDKKWIDGDNVASTEMLGNPCSKHLRDLLSRNPNYSETFVMDSQGANVCMSHRTSDYFQGDEPKFQKAFNDGKGNTFIDERKYDSSAKDVLAQVSVPVMDGTKVIGVLTVGVRVDKLK